MSLFIHFCTMANLGLLCPHFHLTINIDHWFIDSQKKELLLHFISIQLTVIIQLGKSWTLFMYT